MVELRCLLGLLGITGLQDSVLIFPDPSQSPRVKEGRPVNVIGQLSDGLVLNHPGARKFRDRRRIRFPVAFVAIITRLREGDCRLAFATAESETVLLLLSCVFLSESITLFNAQEGSGDRY